MRIDCPIDLSQSCHAALQDIGMGLGVRVCRTDYRINALNSTTCKFRPPMQCITNHGADSTMLQL